MSEEMRDATFGPQHSPTEALALAKARAEEAEEAEADWKVRNLKANMRRTCKRAVLRYFEQHGFSMAHEERLVVMEFLRELESAGAVSPDEEDAGDIGPDEED